MKFEMAAKVNACGNGKLATDTCAQESIWTNMYPKVAYAGFGASMFGVASDQTSSVSGSWQAPFTRALINRDMLLRTPDGSNPYEFATLAAAQTACTTTLNTPPIGARADGVSGWKIADPAVGGSGACLGVAKLDEGGFGLMFDPAGVGAAGGQDPVRYSVYPKLCASDGTCSFPTEYRGFQPQSNQKSACTMLKADPTAVMAGVKPADVLGNPCTSAWDCPGGLTSNLAKAAQRGVISHITNMPAQYSNLQGAVGPNGAVATDFAAARQACLADRTCAGVCRQPNPDFADALYSGYGTYAKPAAPYTVGNGSGTVYLFGNAPQTKWPDLAGRQWDAAPTQSTKVGTNAGIGKPSLVLTGIQVNCAVDSKCVGIVQSADGLYQATKSIVPGPFGSQSWAISEAPPDEPFKPFVPNLPAKRSVADPLPAKWAAALSGAPAGVSPADFESYMHDLCGALSPLKARFLLWHNSQQKADTGRIAIFGNGLEGCERDTISRIKSDLYMEAAKWYVTGSKLPFPDPMQTNLEPGLLIYNMITDPHNVPPLSDSPEKWMVLPTDDACADRPLPTA